MREEFYRNNRRKLMGLINSKSAAIFFAGTAPKMSADAKYPFSPNRNFYYLTGLTDQSIILYMERNEDDMKECLFIERYDELKAKWTGETVSLDEAKRISGISDIRYLDEFESFIHAKLFSDKIEYLYLDLEKDSFSSDSVIGVRFAGQIRDEYPQITIKNAYHKVSSLRLIKDEEEIKEIKNAIRITKEGIYNVWKNARANVKEFEMEAEFDYILKKNGVGHAFDTICAAGINATCLHYVQNNQEIKDGDLLLLDLGAQSNLYNGDISRTFPINGKFTKEQRSYYDIVMLAHKRVFEAIKPGLPFKRLNEIVRETYAEELKKIGLIKEDKEVTKYYFHGVSHYLGLDTHDVGSRDVLLEKGMVLTVEPGIYIPELNIGIRVEDDILVTDEGMENLSEDIIRDADEIEEFMAKNNKYLVNK